MPKPICFMIMPYGTKPTQADPSVGVANIDFNALWERAYLLQSKSLGTSRSARIRMSAR
jgi:hypothetical protein